MSKRLDLPRLEEEIQEYWEKNSIYREVCESRKGKERYYFCQGPPFTSGTAHIGHAWNHAIKDAIIRYKTMQGLDVYRRAGWDMHGLPIEVKVEEEVLRSRSKKEIEEYGIENFISECKKFALQNMNNMTSQLKRLGVWLDWDDPYMSIDPRYMEGVWFLMKKTYEKKLLYEDKQVIHWCPRCETAMAGYEVRDEYRDVMDHSIYVKAKLEDNSGYIVIWTTTPWTLPSNTGIAVHPRYEYVRVEYMGEKYILARERLEVIAEEIFPDGDYRVIEEFRGEKLDGKGYEPMLDIEIQKGIMRKIVVEEELVNLEEGTGCVHLAPGHGEEDFRIGKRYNLEMLSPVDGAGRFTIEPYMGEYIRDSNNVIIKQLDEGGILLYAGKKIHSYPHCWRCKEPLLLRATKQWFLSVSKIRERLLEKNGEIEWVPEWVGSGRFENWLRNAKDWCISRQRYWNTPLPIWRCDCGKLEVIGSLEELRDKATTNIDVEKIDLHRPSIDEIKLKCSCGKEMRRLEDVLDVWLDSGCASWANLGYPNQEDEFRKLFPADFITEGSDQTRGWFYSLLVSSVIAFDEIPYRRVLYHGFALDDEGRKMSKSQGNVIDPFEVTDKYGADVLRYYMLWTSVPWEDLRFSYDGLGIINRLLHMLWNIYSFAETYMELDEYSIEKEYKLEFQLEDRYILSRYNSLVDEVTSDYEKLYLFDVCRKIQSFILELSRFYVKLVRDRVWIEGEDPRKMSVYYTLQHILTGLCKLMAPVAPHITERIYMNLTGERSLHLSYWPQADKSSIQEELEEDMKVAQQIIESVISARQDSGIKLRWPISRIIVAPKGEWSLQRLEDLILKMCNAKELEIKAVETEIVAKLNYSSLGPKLKDKMRELEENLVRKDAGKIKKEMDKRGVYELKGYNLEKGDLIFETRISDNIIAKEYGQGVVYIDSKLDDVLYSEAMAREAIRRIQDMRKELDLEETREMMVSIECGKDFRRHLEKNKRFIEKETRSNLSFGEGGGFIKEWDIEKNKVTVYLEETGNE
ncbi:MAG: isoleucine--tRNA ligase [Candidatus Altiarchaeales archaeon ex4484_2]|nr:MAG: isoleucine--tRNA ligase [Candidatus Altiarchaeales archaeon ex4484_2]